MTRIRTVAMTALSVALVVGVSGCGSDVAFKQASPADAAGVESEGTYPTFHTTINVSGAQTFSGTFVDQMTTSGLGTCAGMASAGNGNSSTQWANPVPSFVDFANANSQLIDGHQVVFRTLLGQYDGPGTYTAAGATVSSGTPFFVFYGHLDSTYEQTAENYQMVDASTASLTVEANGDGFLALNNLAKSSSPDGRISVTEKWTCSDEKLITG